MRIAVYLALAAALATCLVARRAARHVSPPLAAVTLSVSALVAAIAWAWDLALLAATIIGRLGHVAAVGHWSARALALHDPVPVLAATSAGALVAAAAVGLAGCLRRLGRELWRIRAAARTCPPATDDGVLVIDDPAPRALAVPGVPGKVVITTGMVRALTAAERRVLLAHERAHVRFQHGLFRAAVRLAAAVLPVLRPLAAVLPVLRPLVGDCDHQLERWADEAAARTVHDRRLAARALARAALARRTPRGPGPAVALGFADRGVTRRVRALAVDRSGGAGRARGPRRRHGRAERGGEPRSRSPLRAGTAGLGELTRFGHGGWAACSNL